MIAKIKKLILKTTRHYCFIKRDVKIKHIWYENTYGGFYLNPDLLKKNSIVYSFGIGEDISFDRSVIEHHNCNVFGFDPTPKSKKWMKTQKTSKKFHFYDFGISDKNGIVDFYLPKSAEHVSGSLTVQRNINIHNKITVKVKTLKNVMDELGHKHIDVLKMDIEGSEYDVIDNILESNISITQVLVEFHSRMFDDGILKTKNIINKLNAKGYAIFAISDSFKEISFINKSAYNILYK